MKHHGVNPYQAAVGAIVASALCATLLTAAPASAEERTTPPAVSDQQARALDAGVDVSTRVFDVEAAISAGGDPGVVDEFAEGYAAGGGTVRGLREGAAALVAAGVLAIAGGALTSCNAKGRGTVSHNIPGSAIAWCNSQ